LANGRIFHDSLGLIPAIPQWYWAMSTIQQVFLGEVINHAPSVKEALSKPLPSRLRSLPLPANFGSHKLILLSMDGTFLELSKERIRSSHLASRNTLSMPIAVQKRHVESNLNKIFEGAG